MADTFLNYAARVGALIKGRSPVGHTHEITDVDGLVARLAALEYDSGWRNVEGLLINGWTAVRFYIRRVGPVIQFRVNGLDGSAATSGDFISLPTGYHPGSAVGLGFTGRRATGTFRANFNNSGGMQADVGFVMPTEYADSTAMIHAPAAIPTTIIGETV